MDREQSPRQNPTPRLIDQINPFKLGTSLKMAALVGVIVDCDYGARDPRGGRITGLSITSDGLVIASTTAHDSGVFLHRHPGTLFPRAVSSRTHQEV